MHSNFNINSTPYIFRIFLCLFSVIIPFLNLKIGIDDIFFSSIIRFNKFVHYNLYILSTPINGLPLQQIYFKFWNLHFIKDETDVRRLSCRCNLFSNGILQYESPSIFLRPQFERSIALSCKKLIDHKFSSLKFCSKFFPTILKFAFLRVKPNCDVLETRWTW